MLPIRPAASRVEIDFDAGVQPIHASATTRIVRVRHAASSQDLVGKLYLGPAAAQRWQIEAAMLARLAGIAGIVQLAAQPPAQGSLLLQDCGSQSLAQAMARRRLDVTRVLAIGARLAQILSDVHRAGVIHRDINPANIMLSPGGEPVLIDFDLAVPFDAEAPPAQENLLVGTLAYIAPEQTGRTGRVVDYRADLYALGVTLYEMATGVLPFEGDDALQLIQGHLVGQPAAPTEREPTVPRMLSDIVMRLLAKSPNERYQSASGLLHDLLRLQAQAGHELQVFDLGERDFPARLLAPPQLVGRSSELARLHEVLAGSIEGRVHGLLIEGAAGTGKTALIQALRRMAGAAGGLYISGKFDQHRAQSAGADALNHALRQLGSLLLARAGDEGAALRERVLQSVGHAAGMLTRLLPEFELLLGPQPESGGAEPHQLSTRLVQAHVDLLAAIVSATQPLVMVFEDMQWADALSLRVFDRLVNEPSLRGLLMVGTYRGEDVVAPHPLAEMLKLQASGGARLELIRLHPLANAEVGEMLQAMLRLAPEPALALAGEVCELSAGNPFDTVEIVNALRGEGLLRLESNGWTWQGESIRRFAGRSSVIDLLAVRIARLPPQSIALLECMSCIGATVSLDVLAVALDATAHELRERLQAPLDDGLVSLDVGEQPFVQFRHDRVQQAVWERLDAARQSSLQLTLARRLAANALTHSQAAQQYLACAGALSDAGEMSAAANLLLHSGRQLLRNAVPDHAGRYLAAAAALLDVQPHADVALRCEIDIAWHAAFYAQGQLADADSLHDRLWREMLTERIEPAALVEPTCLQMRSVYMRGRIREAIDMGFELLGRLRGPVFIGADDSGSRQGLDELSNWVARERAAANAPRPPTTDRRVLGLANILSRLFPPACFLMEEKTLVWLLLEAQRLWSAHGPSPALMVALSRASMVLIPLRGDWRCGFDIARYVLEVGQAHGFEPETSEARHAFAISASHWFEPLAITAQHALQTRDGFARFGDISFCCFTYGVTNEVARECAPSLASYAADIEAGLALCARAANHLAATLIGVERQLLRCLRGETASPGTFDDAGFSEAAFLEDAASMPVMRITFLLRRAIAAAIWGDTDKLDECTAAAMPLLDSVPGFYITVHAHFLRALALAWRLQRSQASPDAPAQLAQCREWLAARAQDQPDNYQHLLALVQAEEAWAHGDMLAAVAGFESALSQVRSQRRPWHEALITERMGRFHLAQAWRQTGTHWLVQARDLYGAWGASAKVLQMQGEPGAPASAGRPIAQDALPARASLRSGSLSTPSMALDLLGVLRASQALSYETSLGGLSARVHEVLAALTGATHVQLLSWNEDRWELLSPGHAPMAASDAARDGLLARSVIDYARRTGQPLLVEDALADDRFARDPYFANVHQCSLLVVPISAQGGPRALLVLENRDGRAAFNTDGLDTVMLIAGQLAVSLANAALYDEMERRVEARTRELQQTQAQLVATARRAGKAEVANNVLHNVGNVLNSVSVSASIVRRTVTHSRLQGLSHVVALMNEHRSDLSAFMEIDPRGSALMPYLNGLEHALAEEREQVLGDLDRLTHSVDHITHVIATQQSEAGQSGFVELVRPREIMDEAVRVCAQAIARAGCQVIQSDEEIPALLLDRPRLLQILVNLIVNATQAMEGVPEADRTLELGARVEPGEPRVLLMWVKDSGEGIATENLERVLSHGFTTRQFGHGFGLHSSALAAMEMGGKLTPYSAGRGQGATFTVAVPLQQAASRPQ